MLWFDLLALNLVLQLTNRSSVTKRKMKSGERVSEWVSQQSEDDLVRFFSALLNDNFYQ